MLSEIYKIVNTRIGDMSWSATRNAAKEYVLNLTILKAATASLITATGICSVYKNDICQALDEYLVRGMDAIKSVAINDYSEDGTSNLRGSISDDISVSDNDSSELAGDSAADNIDADIIG